MRYVYTDGACDKQRVGGWAWVTINPFSGEIRDSHGARFDTTNNVMELTACIMALTELPDREFTIVTDSAYVSNCFLDRWYDGWRRNGWQNSKKRPVENRDLWEELIGLVESRRSPLHWLHVRGHGKRASDDPEHVLGNALADERAVAARLALAGR